jgi:hypothetical protein
MTGQGDTSTAVTQVPKCVYLGLRVDEDLSWKIHMNHLVAKLRSVVREMTFARSNLTYSAKCIVYHSIAHSRLNYGITAWGALRLYHNCLIFRKKYCIKCAQKSTSSQSNICLNFGMWYLSIKFLRLMFWNWNILNIIRNFAPASL